MKKWALDLLLQLYRSKPVQDQLAKWKVELIAWLREQFTEFLTEMKTELKSWVPIFVKAIMTGIAQSAGQFVVNTEDKITDIIPGQVDDEVLDPMVHRALDKLTELTGISFN